MSSNSYKLLIKRLEYTLAVILMEIDKENKKVVTFEQIGRMLTLLEIFQIILYNENFKCMEKFFIVITKNIFSREQREFLFKRQKEPTKKTQ